MASFGRTNVCARLYRRRQPYVASGRGAPMCAPKRSEVCAQTHQYVRARLYRRQQPYVASGRGAPMCAPKRSEVCAQTQVCARGYTDDDSRTLRQVGAHQCVRPNAARCAPKRTNMCARGYTDDNSRTLRQVGAHQCVRPNAARCAPKRSEVWRGVMRSATGVLVSSGHAGRPRSRR
jgi:hypothetical protein